MGVPAFYRWLAEKYPKIVVDLLEKRDKVVSGEVIPLNKLDANPNGQEFDNLYIDMNGLIHPCSHPEDREAPTSEAEMYVNVTKYVDRLFAAIRPRRLLFLAIDGVAPRAKMNQQRARRFRAAQEAAERQEALNQVLEEMAELGLNGPDKGGGAPWDSNVITPGTEFMDRLSVYLRFYIIDRMNRDPAWRAIKVVLSDASEPGEGEHKIMKFVRSERSQPGYDPNQRHVLHGLDADLIMLGLSTHEVHFSILREEVTFGRQKHQAGMSEAKKMLHEESIGISSLRPEDEWVYSKSLQFVHIKVLREYLAFEFAMLPQKLPNYIVFDLERVIDDFVFICFFVGNDFLPHLPSLDIRDGAIDFLVQAYKEMLPSMGDYLTSPGGDVNLRQVDVLLARVGEVEDEVFQRRKAAEDRELQRRNRGAHHQGRSRAQIANAVANEGNAILEHFKRTRQSFGAAGRDAERIVKSPEGIAPSRAEDSSEKNRAAAAALKNRLGAMKRAETDPLEGEVAITGLKRGLSNSLDMNLVSEKVPRLENSVPDGEESVSFRADAMMEGGDQLEGSSLNGINVADDENDDEDEVEYNEDDEDADDADVGDFAAAMKKTPIDIAADVRKLSESAGADGPKKTSVEDIVKNRLAAKQQAIIEGNKGIVEDRIRFHESGWKARYYEDNFKKQDIEKGGGLSVMLREYVKGLCWVLKYYYTGCPSWNWYYPFHYAPFASDLVNIDTFDVTFELSKPFLPTEQLLAVFPSDSVHAIPQSCQWLMTSDTSPIRDLYSSDIPIDPNGKILPWLWVVLLPFINEERITDAMKLCLPNMSSEEKRRNSFGKSYMFLHRSHALCCFAIARLSYENPAPEVSNDVDTTQSEEVCRFNPAAEGGGVGGILRLPTAKCFFPLSAKVTAPDRPLRAFRDIVHNDAACFEFDLPQELPHLSSLLEGADPGPPVLTPSDSVIRIPRLNKGMNIMDIAHRMKGGEGMYHQNSQMGFGAYHEVQDQYQRQQRHQYGEQQGLRSFGESRREGHNGGGGGSSTYSYRSQGYSYESRADENRSSGAFGVQQSSYVGGGYGSSSSQRYGGYAHTAPPQQYAHGGAYAHSGGQSQYSLPVSSGTRPGESYSYNPSSRQSFSSGGGSYVGGQQKQGSYVSGGHGYQQQAYQQQQPFAPTGYSQQQRSSGGYHGGYQGQREDFSHRPPLQSGVPPFTSSQSRDNFSFRQTSYPNHGGNEPSRNSGGDTSIADMRAQLIGGQYRGPPPQPGAPPPRPFSHSRDPRLRK